MGDKAALSFKLIWYAFTCTLLEEMCEDEAAYRSKEIQLLGGGYVRRFLEKCSLASLTLRRRTHIGKSPSVRMANVGLGTTAGMRSQPGNPPQRKQVRR